MNIETTKKCTTLEMIKYSTGECAFSLVNNSLIAFAAIYYTDALGLDPILAGLAMFVSIFWDAVTDPVMGHISDNTRSRFGKRHPFILLGGMSMAVSFYFLWQIPEIFQSSSIRLFWYLVMMNLVLRTAFTVFIVPYTALGFEICTDYTGRTKLQGIRFVLNMVANVFGVALGWSIFFKDQGDVRGVTITDNFVTMGTVFTIATFLIVLFVTFTTRKHIQDSRHEKVTGNRIQDFYIDMKEIIFDKYPRWVFAYTLVVIFGIAFAGAYQGHLYEHFMKFDSSDKSIAHGISMVMTAIGALAASVLVRRYDKKGAVFIGVIASVVGNGILSILFLPGLLRPEQTIVMAGVSIPFALIIFTFLHGCYWMGNGVLFPVALSMMADISEIHQLETGMNKDGIYSAMYSFVLKASSSFGILFSMICLKGVGFVAGAASQNPEVAWRLGAATLLAGPIISLTALLLIRKYPVTKALIESIRTQAEST
jgi:GPH family glycoside/pentoside/hexuronide:cation symporter